jgi:DNA-binding Lrp family transcriptional regulator
MAVQTFLLIETDRGEVKEIVGALRQLEGVISAVPVSGPYDVIAVLEGDNLAVIGDLRNKIRQIDHVSKLVSCISLSWPSESSIPSLALKN